MYENKFAQYQNKVNLQKPKVNFMKSDNNLPEMESLFLALADKTRLRLLNLMRGGEICVFFFTEVTGENQPKVSRHLAYLKNAGIVSARREGKWMFYKIVEPKTSSAAKILRDTLEWLETQSSLQADYDKLIQISRALKISETGSGELADNIFVETNMKAAKREQLEIHLL